MSDRFQVPILERMIPAGIAYGWTLLVEFDPDSLWYQIAANIVAKCLLNEKGADYHAFSNHPDDVRSNLTRLGVDVSKAESSGLLWIIDYYSPGIGAKSKENWTVSSLKLTDLGIDRRQRWAVQRPCLHLDDIWSIVFEHNEEKDVVQFIKTKILPGTRETQRCQILGLMRGVHSEYVYRSLEDAAQGIVDVRTQEIEGKPETYVRVRSMRGETHDKTLHQILLNQKFEVSLK